MPLSQCPKCGFTCRSLIFTAQPPACPECEARMSFIGRATADEKHRKLGTPKVSVPKLGHRLISN